MHLAFISIPAAGHVNPTLAVVAELVRRGHRVTYFTSANFARRIRDAGAAFRASGKDWLAAMPVPIQGQGQEARAQLMLPLMHRVLEDLRESFPVPGVDAGRAAPSNGGDLPGSGPPHG